MQLLSLNLLKDDAQPYAVLQLSRLLYDYFKERHQDILVGDLTATTIMVNHLLAANNYIYFVQDDNQNILGFVTMSVNDQFGMVTPHLVIDYMYIKPEFRGSRVTALLFGVVGHVADTMEMDCIGTTFVTSSNIRNAEVVKGVETATAYLYRRDDFREKYKTYIKRYI